MTCRRCSSASACDHHGKGPSLAAIEMDAVVPIPRLQGRVAIVAPVALDLTGHRRGIEPYPTSDSREAIPSIQSDLYQAPVLDGETSMIVLLHDLLLPRPKGRTRNGCCYRRMKEGGADHDGPSKIGSPHFAFQMAIRETLGPSSDLPFPLHLSPLTRCPIFLALSNISSSRMTKFSSTAPFLTLQMTIAPRS